jgi:trk system potassium uptake protein TrkA
MNPKQILIVGGGLVGQALAARLSRDGCDVTLVESDPHKVRDLADTLDIQVVEGNGSTAPVLRRAGAAEAGLVIASTDNDAANMIVGFLARDLFHVPRVVVRLRDPGHEEGFALVAGGTDHVSVNPDAASVERIATLMEVPGAIDVVTFFDGQLLVAGFRITSASEFAGLRVSDMALLFAETPTLVVAIHRGDDWYVPDGAWTIEEGDIVYFSIARRDLANVLELVGVERDLRKRVVIAGGTPIGLQLAKRLARTDARVLLIEKDEVLATRAAESLDITVIHGRATDQGLLEDEEIEKASDFVAVTDDHETNLVAGLLAKRVGAGRAFVLVDNPALVALVGGIGIDAIISPRSVTIGLTLQHIRGGGVRSGAALLEDQVEIVEVEALGDTRLTSGGLAQIGLPRGVLVAAVQRGETLLVPSGSDRVRPGDRVLLIATSAIAPSVTAFTGPR